MLLKLILLLISLSDFFAHFSAHIRLGQEMALIDCFNKAPKNSKL